MVETAANAANSSFFNVLDYIYIAIMLLSTVFGLANGFARTILSVLAWVGSGFLAAFITPYVCKILTSCFESAIIAQLVSSSVSYAISLSALLIAAYFASDMIKQSLFSGVDRALGLLFGLIRGLVIPVGVVAVFIAFNIPREKFLIIEQSKISELLFGAMRNIVPKFSIGNEDSKKEEDVNAMFNKYQSMIKKRIREQSNEAKKALFYQIKTSKYKNIGSKARENKAKENKSVNN